MILNNVSWPYLRCLEYPYAVQTSPRDSKLFEVINLQLLMYLLHCQTQCILGAQQINAGTIAKAPKVHIGFSQEMGLVDKKSRGRI